MSSFVFNSFKKRYLNGEVPSADEWTFIPVADTFKKHFEFDDVRLDHYRTICDFYTVNHNKNADYFYIHGDYINKNQFGAEQYIKTNNANFQLMGKDFLEGIPVTFRWKKVIDDNDFNNKPMFITKDNYGSLLTYYTDTLKDNPYIEVYLDMGGFYFIRSKDELEWFAERVNQNDRIIGVIGDNFDGVISKPIGYDEKHPFNGILDGNYFTFDITVKAQYTDNGIVGVLGSQGIVRNFVLSHTNANRVSIDCEKPINLTHIKSDGRDINCGLLVGRNYGIIENIDASNLNSFNIYGCVPSVYSVTNKSDNYKWNESENIVRAKFDANNENFLYLNSYCINSPGNICPYVGYFNEGKFADDATVLSTDMAYDVSSGFNTGVNELQFMANGFKSQSVYTEENNIDWSIRVNTFKHVYYRPLGTFYTLYETYGGEYEPNNDRDLMASLNEDMTKNPYLASFIKNPLYYGVDIYGYFTVRGVGNIGHPDTYIENYNSNLCQKVFGDSRYRDCSTLEPEYEMTRVSMRPHPYARAAYNVGTIIGANYGTAQNIQVSAVVKNTSNFVGFIGGLAGKQANGYVNNISVYMDNQFKYDFENRPELGDIVYYKQTPLFPDAVTEYFQSKFNQYPTRDQKDETKFLNLFCKSWYDSTRDDASELTYVVNTATTVTDDVISYKLRPIFVVGGMFGRYIPTWGVNELNQTMICQVENSTILYKDNYYEKDSYKRPENAFGSLIGKVDYSTTNNSYRYTNSIAFNNCKISAISNVGEPFRYFENNFNTDTNEWEPVVTMIDDNTSALNSGMSERRYVGIYEIKNNLVDGVSYTVNSAVTADPSGNLVYKSPVGVTTTAKPPQNKVSLSELNIYWGTDYPIEFSAHNGGLIQTHDMTPFIWDVNTNPDYRWTVSGKTWSGWDILHQCFYYPNIDPTNNKLGNYNKRNVAAKLVALNGCYSNVDNWIELYDDYLNNWNYMELPPSSEDISTEDLSSNTFNDNELYLIKKYWNRVGTRNGYVNRTEVSSNLGFDTDSAHSALYLPNSALFSQGLVQQQINPYIANGTQNTYDGYTTVVVPHEGWYNRTDITYHDSLSRLIKPNFTTDELNCYDSDSGFYYNPKRYVKNIMKLNNYFWNVYNVEQINWENKINFTKRDSVDNYFYYTYETINGDENHVDTQYCSLKKSFAFTLPVEFAAHGSTMGYATPLTQNDAMTNSNSTLSLGEYLSPVAIRYNIEHSKLKDEDGNKYFETTSISSKNKFGGLLVVDTIGRNVMFLDNDNNVPVTGNAISFPVTDLRINNKKTKKLVMEVK